MTLYPTRTTISLNGIWDFGFAENRFLEDVREETFEFRDLINVPGNFDMLPMTFCKHGCGVYRREFFITEDVSDALLKIDGIGLRGRFQIDGKMIGYINMPYTGVAFHTGALAAGKHTIYAAIDNCFSNEKMKLFLPYYDFRAFGGFHRGVELQLLPEGICFDRVQIRTSNYRTGKVTARILLLGNYCGPLELHIKFDTGNEFPLKLLFVNGEAETKFTVPGFKLWSPENPQLHSLTVRTTSDTITETFGIREIRIGNKQLELNGTPILLKGFNRHEEDGSNGAATTLQTMLTDLQHLRQCGCNFIRGAHYPQNQTFLDLCDRMGFLVWEESLGWGNNKQILGDKDFIKLQKEQAIHMIRRSINHPSVIIWGFLNEFDSCSQEGRNLCKELVDLIHSEDNSRPATFASRFSTSDECFDLVDLIACNTYPGWATENACEPEETIRPCLDKIIQYCRSKVPAEKPILISEIGICAIYGAHDPAATQWSEEFQADYLSRVIREVFDSGEICGLSLWQLNNAHTYHRRGGCLRVKPLGENSAGVYDLYRRPKLAAQTVSELFHVLSGTCPEKRNKIGELLLKPQ